jgi:hypothetical protein
VGLESAADKVDVSRRRDKEKLFPGHD